MGQWDTTHHHGQPPIIGGNPNNNWFGSPWNFSEHYGGHENLGAHLIEKSPGHPYYGGPFYDIGPYARIGFPDDASQSGHLGAPELYHPNLIPQQGEHFGGGHDGEDHHHHPHSHPTPTFETPWDSPEQWIPQALNFNHNDLGASAIDGYSAKDLENAKIFANTLGNEDGIINESERLNAMYSLSVQALYLHNAGYDTDEMLRVRNALEELPNESENVRGPQVGGPDAARAAALGS